MRVQSSLLIYLLVILAIFTAGCAETINENESSQNIENHSENKSSLLTSTSSENAFEKIEDNVNPESKVQYGDLQLIVIPEKTELKKEETFNIYLTLTNVGNNSLNTWIMYEQVSYDISFRSLVDNSFAKYYRCGVIARTPLTDESLVELKSGESLNETFNSHCWVLNPGEYMLSAVYHTGSDEMISKPYWRGEVKSNEVLIEILDTQNNLTSPSL